MVEEEDDLAENQCLGGLEGDLHSLQISYLDEDAKDQALASDDKYDSMTTACIPICNLKLKQNKKYLIYHYSYIQINIIS